MKKKHNKAKQVNKNRTQEYMDSVLCRLTTLEHEVCPGVGLISLVSVHQRKLSFVLPAAIKCKELAFLLNLSTEMELRSLDLHRKHFIN